MPVQFFFFHMREYYYTSQADNTDLQTLYRGLLGVGPNSFGSERSFELVRQTYLNQVKERVASLNVDSAVPADVSQEISINDVRPEITPA